MKAYQKDFLNFAIEQGVLRFGQFILKSGRVSPYFFNAGLFQSGAALSRLGRYYAQCIIDSEIQYDVLFGPAYKGIPLVAATAMALYDQHDLDVPYTFNRKEAKTHGEGGSLVGAPLTGRVLVIDDVITAGTAIREAADIVQCHQATLAGVVIALDRQERGKGILSAVQEVGQQYDIPISSLVTLADLIAHIQTSTDNNPSILKTVQDYRFEYGINLNKDSFI